MDWFSRDNLHRQPSIFPKNGLFFGLFFCCKCSDKNQSIDFWVSYTMVIKSYKPTSLSKKKRETSWSPEATKICHRPGLWWLRLKLHKILAYSGTHLVTYAMEAMVPLKSMICHGIYPPFSSFSSNRKRRKTSQLGQIPVFMAYRGLIWIHKTIVERIGK